jgi:hypothetical protein
VKERWAEITPKVDASEMPILECPACLQSAAEVDGGLHCHFCGYAADAESSADEYVTNVFGISEYRTIKHGGVWPVYTCPCCEADALVDFGPADELGGARYQCFDCGESYADGELYACDMCGALFVDRDGMGICPACHGEMDDED